MRPWRSSLLLLLLLNNSESPKILHATISVLKTFLCLHQDRLSGGITLSSWSFISFVCYQTREHNILKTNEPMFWCQLAQVVNAARAWNVRLWSHGVKGQGHTRPKLDLEPWRRHHSRLPWCHKWGGQICPDPTLWYFIFFRLPRISRKSSDTDTV